MFLPIDSHVICAYHNVRLPNEVGSGQLIVNKNDVIFEIFIPHKMLTLIHLYIFFFYKLCCEIYK